MGEKLKASHQRYHYTKKLNFYQLLSFVISKNKNKNAEPYWLYQLSSNHDCFYLI